MVEMKMYAYDADKDFQCEILVAIFLFNRQKRGVATSDRLEQVNFPVFMIWICLQFFYFLNLNSFIF